MPLDRRLLMTSAVFLAGIVGTLVLLRITGVQRDQSVIVLVAWLCVLAGFCIGKLRAR